MFRHYLELRFKDIIVYGQVLSDEPVKWRHGHDLQKLWLEVRRLCEVVYGPDLTATWKLIGDCVAELIQLDPDSTSFRYPLDTRGQPISERLVIGLKALHSTITDIGDYLDGTSMDMSVKVQDLPQL